MSLRPSERTEIRQKMHKPSVDAEVGRARRERIMVGIRKDERDRTLNEKRSLPASAAAVEEAHSPAVEKKLESLPILLQGLYSNDRSMQLEAAKQFRKQLSDGQCPPIDEGTRSRVVPRFVEFLAKEAECPDLQFEAAWVLTNIASRATTNKLAVIEHDAVSILVKLFSSPREDICAQAVWALGSMARDSTKCRDLFLMHGAMLGLLQQLNEHVKLSMLRIATWTLSNFCCGKTQPDFMLVKPALPVLRQLILSQDEEVITNSCWALYGLSCGSSDKTHAVVETGVCSRLVELLNHSSPTVLRPALCTVCNIVTGDEMQIQRIIDHLALPCLFNLLTTFQEKSIKREACCTISNITAGTKEQIQAVIDANIIGPLLHLLENAEFDVRKEAAWAIYNATCGGTPDQIEYLVKQGCIKPLCDLLKHKDARIVSICVDSLDNILRVGEVKKMLGASNVNLFALMVEEADGLNKIEDLQNHDNVDIYDKAFEVLESYLLEDDDQQPLQPPVGKSSLDESFFDNWYQDPHLDGENSP